MTEGISEMHLSDTSGKRKIIVQNESPSSKVVCFLFLFGFLGFFVFFNREHLYFFVVVVVEEKFPKQKSNV